MDKKDHWISNFMEDVVEHKVCQDQDKIEAAKKYDEKIASVKDPIIKDALECKKEQILAGNASAPEITEEPPASEEPKAEEPEKTAETEKTEKDPEKEPKN